MNPLFKAYCRAFQTVFHIAIPFLPYKDPELYCEMEQIPQIIQKKGRKKPLIVTDKGIHGLGLLDGLKAALDESQTPYAIYDGTVPNPSIANVEEARSIYLSEGCDCLVAVGGGSSMDCAKGCGIRIARPDKTIPQMRGILKVRKKPPLTIAVPTTAGTGSEGTVTAVITDENNYKYPVSDICMVPDVAVLDYRTTLGLPGHITSTTGMDALVHATEAFIGRSTVKETRAYAIEAGQLIRQYLLRAYENPGDAEARAKMLYASNRAGMAFSKSYVGYVHGVAHSLGGQYGTPHGLANAVACPYVLEAYGEHCHKRLGLFAREIGVAPAGTSDAEASRIFIEWFREMNAAMDIPSKIEGIREDDIPGMAAKAHAECNPLYPVPVLWDAQELQKLYRLVMA